MTNEEIYEQQTLKHLGNNPMGTRMDIVCAAMEQSRADATAELRAELERVKGIIKETVIATTIDILLECEGMGKTSAEENAEKCWQQYKTENNL